MQLEVFELGMHRCRTESSSHSRVSVPATARVWSCDLALPPSKHAHVRAVHLAQVPVGGAPVSALRGPAQVTRDRGVLSFTTAHFPSFHHAAIRPTPP